tara:strand:- start:112 stop:351 length:240 start_codon:yes stop_codon:yes gene_type:complete
MCIIETFPKLLKSRRFFSEICCFAITFAELLIPKELKINEDAIEACKKCLLEIMFKFPPIKNPKNYFKNDFGVKILLMQ